MEFKFKINKDLMKKLEFIAKINKTDAFKWLSKVTAEKIIYEEAICREKLECSYYSSKITASEYKKLTGKKITDSMKKKKKVYKNSAKKFLSELLEEKARLEHELKTKKSSGSKSNLLTEIIEEKLDETKNLINLVKNKRRK